MTDSDASARRSRRVFWMVLGAVVLFRMWFVTTLPLTGDEAYHWEWSRHLAAGYYDHPPLTAFLIRLSTEVCTVSNEFSVRLPAILLLAGAACVAFAHAARLARSRGGSAAVAARAGLWAGVLMLIVPVFAGTGMYMSTDPPAIFFWTLALYLLDRALTGGRWADWIMAGVAAGLAVQGKFLTVFFVPAAGITVLALPSARSWLRRPHPYVASAAGIGVCLPFLYWNATHGWATFLFNLVYRHEPSPFTWRHPAESLAGQVLALSPGLWFAAVAALVWAARQAVRRKETGTTLLLAAAACPHAYFLYASLRQRVSLHWPACGWVPVLILLAVAWSETAGIAPPWRRWSRQLAVGLCVVMMVLALFAVHAPPSVIESLIGSRRQVGALRTHWAYERFGWDEIGRRAEAARDELLAAQGDARRGVFVLCDEYGLAADLAFYMPSQHATHLWAARRRHGENYRFWDDFATLASQDAVLVSKHLRRMKKTVPVLKHHFEAVGEPEEVPIRVDGRVVRSFFLLRCKGFDGKAPRFMTSGIH